MVVIATICAREPTRIRRPVRIPAIDQLGRTQRPRHRGVLRLDPRRTRSRDGAPPRPAHSSGGRDPNTARDLPVALPERHLAREERIVRRRLHVAVNVECPRPYRVLARGRAAPLERPEPPREPASVARAVPRKPAVQHGGPPRPAVDL